MTEKKTYSVSEVAQGTDRCYMTVWSWIRQGRLATTMENGRHVITESAIEKAVNSVRSFRTASQGQKTASIA